MRRLIGFLFTMLVFISFTALASTPNSEDFLTTDGSITVVNGEIHAPDLDSGFEETINSETEGFGVVVSPNAIGIVAIQTESYSNYPNINATLLAKNEAYWIAYTKAKGRLLAGLEGYRVKNKERFEEFIEMVDAAATSTQIRQVNINKDIQLSVEGIMRGYITYKVEDRVNEDGTGEIMVSLIITPKTLTSVNNFSGSVVIGNNVKEAMDYIFKEIEAAIIPPVGAKTILIPGNDRPVMVAFGGEIVRYYEDPSARSMALSKSKDIAEMKALAALNSLLRGEHILWETGFTESYEGLTTASLGTGTESILNNMAKYVSEFTAISEGQVPKGTITRTYTSPSVEELGYGWALGVAVYSPEFITTELLDMFHGKAVEPMKKQEYTPLHESSENFLDNKEVPVGPSGQVTSDKDVF